MGELGEDLRHAVGPLRRLVLVLGGAAVLVYLLSGLYLVEAEQRGVVKRFGRIVDDNAMPGMHYHWPWPVESVEHVRATVIRSLELNFSPRDDSEQQGELMTGDKNLLMVSLSLEYTIVRPSGFLTAAVDPEAVLRRIAQAVSVSRFAGGGVDELLTTGRNALQRSLRQAIQQQTDALGLGLRIKSAQVKQLAPPVSTKRAFSAVAAARADKRKVLQHEQGERSSRLAKARGEAELRVQQAHAHVREMVEKARGDAGHFETAWREYRGARSATAYRLYLETMERILSRAELAVIEPSAEPPPAPGQSTRPGPGYAAGLSRWRPRTGLRPRTGP